MTKSRLFATAVAFVALGTATLNAQGRSGNAGNSGNTHTSNAQASTPGGSPAGTTTHGSVANGNSHKPTTTTTTTSTSGSTTTTTPPNAIAAKIAKNPSEMVRISAMLPQGMTLDEASAGFRNQGQFIAALNASKRTNIPFEDLKSAMTVDNLSLGQAVKQLQPSATAPTTTGTGTTGSGSTTDTSTTTSTYQPKP